MYNKIYVKPRFDFKELVKGLTEQQFNATAFISIHEPVRPVELFGECSKVILEESDNVLNLWFDDSEEPTLSDGKSAVLFDVKMAAQIKLFTLRNWDKENFLIHCTAGQSRSGAVGSCLADFFGIDWHRFLRDNGQVKPNALVKRILNGVLFPEEPSTKPLEYLL